MIRTILTTHRNIAVRNVFPSSHYRAISNIPLSRRAFCGSSASSSHDGDGRLSVAVVGAGPSGFYTAKYLRSEVAKKTRSANGGDGSPLALSIDVIDRLPTPYGLVRSGVAPDHPEVKNVQNDFRATVVVSEEEEEDSSSSSSSSSSSIAFFGNVEVGREDAVTLPGLLSLYDVVVLAYGCGSDRRLDLGGPPLRGVLSAREFVAWYNGHPDHVGLGDELSALLSSSSSEDEGDGVNDVRVAVIGQGNVALDCARVLAKGGSGLYDTDLAAHALPVLRSGARSTTVLGRRGHVQGAFTIKELRELTKLEQEGHDASFRVRKDELDSGTTPATLEELRNSRPKTRVDKLLRESAEKISCAPTTSKEVSIRFLLSPVEVVARDDDPTRVGSLVCERTRLEGEAHNQIAVGTGEREVMDVDLVLVSVGYRGEPTPGLGEDAFDAERGVVRHANGKVTGASSPEHGLYVSGWLKRGPSGIIGTNIHDAKETVSTIVSDLDDLRRRRVERRRRTTERADDDDDDGRTALLRLLRERKVDVVDWASFEMIDAVETSRERRRSDAQPREKITSVDEMISIVSKHKK